MQEPFHFSLRVEFEDCDLFGVAYHANYLNYAERARSAGIAERGIPFKDWVAEGVGLAVGEARLQYRKPFRLYDPVHVAVTWQVEKERLILVKHRFTSQKFVDEQATPLHAEVDITLVCVDTKGFRPARLPDKFIEILCL